jgi:hypothetical protein
VSAIGKTDSPNAPAAVKPTRVVLPTARSAKTAKGKEIQTTVSTVKSRSLSFSFVFLLSCMLVPGAVRYAFASTVLCVLRVFCVCVCVCVFCMCVCVLCVYFVLCVFACCVVACLCKRILFVHLSVRFCCNRAPAV